MARPLVRAVDRELKRAITDRTTLGRRLPARTVRRRLAGDADEATLQVQLEKAHRQIAEDFEFVAQCNIGGEFMADEKIERLEQIAQRTWVRHLDDRLGISQDEAALKATQPPPVLPVVEQVLADKPEQTTVN